MCRSEGFAFTGFDIPWERGGWGLNALGKFFRRSRRRRPPGFGKWAVLEFYYKIGASGVRGSIRLVFRSTDARILRKVVVGKFKYPKRVEQKIKNGENGHSIINLLYNSRFIPYWSLKRLLTCECDCDMKKLSIFSNLLCKICHFIKQYIFKLYNIIFHQHFSPKAAAD